MSLSKRCPECDRNGRDSTGNHLFLMEDGVTWCCTHADYHSDGERYYESGGVQVSRVPGQKSEVEEEPYEGCNTLMELLNGIKEEDTAVPLPPSATVSSVHSTYRGIEPWVYDKYGVRATYDKAGNLLELCHDVYDGEGNKLAEKVRKVDDKKFFIRDGKTAGIPVQFFGQSIFPSAKKLLITEGELDAKSAYAMLQSSKYTKGVAVVSLPFGAKIQAILDNQKYLKNFKEIYISMDQDKAGDEVSRDISLMIPNAKFLSLPKKDANEMLEAGLEQDFQSAFWNAEERRPDTIIRPSDVLADVLKKPVMGTPWPWPSLTEATYGRNGGQGIYVGAGVKQGKSEFINEVVAFDISAGRKIAVLKYEEPPFMTVKRVAGKMDGIFYHKPGVIYKDEDLEARANAIDPYLLMYPAFGQATWESTQAFIRYAALSGCETIIIDPLTKLTNTLDPSATETELRKISDELACMAQDMGFFYIVTCPLKAPLTGPPHERGGKVQSNQFRGSRAMMENTFYMLGIERNRDPDLPVDEQNTSTFVLLEDRNFGNSAKFKVFYDNTNQSYLEPSFSNVLGI